MVTGDLRLVVKESKTAAGAGGSLLYTVRDFARRVGIPARHVAAGSTSGFVLTFFYLVVDRAAIPTLFERIDRGATQDSADNLGEFANTLDPS